MEQIIDFNIYNYTIDEMEKLCELKYNYVFSDISIQAMKTKKSILKTFTLSSMKALEIEIFFQKLVSRLERNLLNRNINKIIINKDELKKMMNSIISSYNKIKNRL